MENLKIGDIVVLKSGSIKMTVINTGDGNADCAYYKYNATTDMYNDEATLLVYPVESLCLAD